MKNKIKLTTIIFIMVFIYSCRKSFATKEELVAHINDEDNGYSQTKVINNVKVNVTYKPSELMVYQEELTPTEKQKDSLLKKYNQSLYFILSYSKEGKEIFSTIKESRSDFNDLQNTLTFGMNKKVSLTTTKKDTVPLIDYNFPRTYGMSRSTTLIFVFKKNEITNNGELSFNIEDIGIGTGDIKFKFNSKIIN